MLLLHSSKQDWKGENIILRTQEITYKNTIFPTQSLQTGQK